MSSSLMPTLALGSILTTGFLAGCESRIDPETPSAEEAVAEDPPSLWHPSTAGPIVAIEVEEQQELLAEAVRRARETAAAARSRWEAEPEDARGSWAIKWAARTESGTTEYLWVEPLRWSPFRIEGRLASTPLGPLPSGRKLNDPVHFPVEQLVDWVRYEGADFTGAREGGFTMDALEGRFGEP